MSYLAVSFALLRSLRELIDQEGASFPRARQVFALLNRFPS